MELLDNVVLCRLSGSDKVQGIQDGLRWLLEKVRRKKEKSQKWKDVLEMRRGEVESANEVERGGREGEGGREGKK